MKENILSNGNEYVVERKKIKNLILRVKEDGLLKVSAPFGVEEKTIEDFVVSKSDWIDNRRKIILQNDMSKVMFLNDEIINILGKPMVLKTILADRERGEIKKDEIILFSKNPDDSKYNQKIFYKQFDNLIALVFDSILKKVTDSNVVVKRRVMKKRWGTCFIDKNTIQLNKKLIHAPKEYIVYVILHELVHFQYPHHGKTFYEELGKKMPNHKNYKKELNKRYSIYL